MRKYLKGNLEVAANSNLVCTIAGGISSINLDIKGVIGSIYAALLSLGK